MFVIYLLPDTAPLINWRYSHYDLEMITIFDNNYSRNALSTVIIIIIVFEAYLYSFILLILFFLFVSTDYRTK